MHGCVQCAVLLILKISQKGNLGMHECAQCAVLLILSTSNRGELGMHGCAPMCFAVDPEHK
jgi:ssDNA-binding Zn-finger/Zn-ribbon topoisomerase 1